jgi:hypothetical protein
MRPGNETISELNPYKHKTNINPQLYRKPGSLLDSGIGYVNLDTRMQDPVTANGRNSMTSEELKTLLDVAKASGCDEVTIDGNTYKFTSKPNLEAIRASQVVLESKPEDLVKPMSVFDEPDEELVKYWSTPYYDVLIAQREEQNRLKKEST